ncbi:MAG TPA: tyrosine-type recombinase/integrase [Epulopiscium sp.]|nr:tyrosine-type recombinase/integrase [Candidatus Epulonipiscium sp.]
MSKKLPKFISESEAVKLLSAINQKCASGARNHAILMIMYRAGLRVSEVANLAPQDMDFESGMIYVQAGKGEKDRYVPMDPSLIKSCKNWLKHRPEGNYFFCTFKSGQLDTRYIREMTYRTSIKAGVFIQDGKEKKEVNPHALRHSFATEILKSGDFNIRELQEMLGHGHVTTTQIYTHVTQADIAKKMKNRRMTTI